MKTASRKQQIREACVSIATNEPWYAVAAHVLTGNEKDEVGSLWVVMPRGTTWTQAFLEWMRR